MSRKNEIKNIEIIENKPYITKKEAGLLLEKAGKNLDKKISQLLRNKYLIPLKKGLYTTKIFSLRYKDNFEEYLANVIYYPSYLSLEYVLSKEGILAENVYVFTSVTLKSTRKFTNNFGTFLYQKVKNKLFTGYYLKDYCLDYKIKMASKAKALFDYFYLKNFNMIKNIKDLRLNLTSFKNKDWDEFYFYVNLSQSKKMKKIFKLIKDEYAN